MPRNGKKIVLDRRAKVADMYLKCVPQFKIAEKLDVSPSQVSRDLKKLAEEWQKSALQDIGELKARELEKLNTIEDEAWLGYKRSQEEKLKKSVKKKTGGFRSGTEQMQTKEQMIGDPKWMDIILKCVAKREEILGYGAARKLDVTTGGDKMNGGAVIILPSNGREVVKEEENDS